MGIKKQISELINQIFHKFNLEIIRAHPREAIKFARDYFNKKEITAAEIGVFFGENAFEINKNLKVKKLYLIDPYENYEDYKTDEICSKLKKARKNAHRINSARNIIWIENSSEDATKRINEEIDFLYIDGNHEYNYVKKDLELYWPKIKKGGIMAGHDIQGVGVSKALIEFVKRKKLEVFFGDRRDWWIIK